MGKVTITIDVENGVVVVKNQGVSLCKSCGKPVEELSKSNDRLVPSAIPSLTVTDGVHRTPVSTVSTDQENKEQTPFVFDRTTHPFNLHGLTDFQIAAVGYMVAVFRSLAKPKPLAHDEFNDILWSLVAAGEGNDAQRDAVLREAWNPTFWRTRPEFTVTLETIEANPAIL